MSLETRVQRLEAKDAIRELKHRYGYYLDRQRWDDLRDLFTEDVSLQYSREGLDGYEGQDELDGFVETVASQRNFMAHMFHNPVIEVDGEEAEGRWYFEAALTDTDDRAMWAQGRYDDRYLRVDDEWKIRKTVTTYHYSTAYDGGWSDDILVG